MADNESTYVLKEAIETEGVSEEDHNVNEGDQTHSDHEGLIKKLSIYNRFDKFILLSFNDK